MPTILPAAKISILADSQEMGKIRSTHGEPENLSILQATKSDPPLPILFFSPGIEDFNFAAQNYFNSKGVLDRGNMKGLDSSSGRSIDPRGHGKKKERPEWIKNLSRCNKPNTWLAIEQLVGTFVPYFLIFS